MRTKETIVYTFDELSDRAKENARDWYRQGMEFDAEYIIEDAVRMGAILGITIGTRTARLMGGGTRQEPVIYWELNPMSAGFDGSYYYAKGAPKNIRAEAPQDTDLHAIADDLAAVQRTAFYQLIAAIRTAGRSGTDITVDVERPDSPIAVTEAQADAIEDAIRDFAGWIAKQIDREYEYQNSAECIDENIRANEYEFDEDGRTA